jgi:nucleoside-diphosphate kinase
MEQFIERTLFMVKPDGVKRKLIGESIKRIENAGLKIVGMKMVQPTEDQANRHYPSEEEDKDWFLGVAEKAKKGYKEKGMEWKYKDDLDYGRMIKSFLVDFITSGPVIAMVIEGPNAVSMVRKLSGVTEPRSAQPGTIRGDYAIDSYDMANTIERAVKNVVHASSSVEDAEKEIKVWFKESEIVKFKRCDEEEMFAGFKK